MIVVATDAPLDARQLTRVARRAVFALARTGAAYSHGSGDYAVAFTTARPGTAPPLADATLSPLFEAVLDAVEEAVLNSLLTATTTTGHAGTHGPRTSRGPTPHRHAAGQRGPFVWIRPGREARCVFRPTRAGSGACSCKAEEGVNAERRQPTTTPQMCVPDPATSG